MILNNLKSLFISVFFIGLFIFFISQIPLVLADCNVTVFPGVGCSTSGSRSNGGLNFSNCDTKVDAIGSSDWFWRVCGSESGNDGQNCYGNTRTEKCIKTNTPAAPIGYNGKPCQVNFYDDGSLKCNNYFGSDWTYWGKWNESKGSCDICNADLTVAERIFCDYDYCGAAATDCRIDYGGFPIWCGSACGASPECDGVKNLIGEPPSSGTGTCNNCVFAAGPPQCSDGVDNDGDTFTDTNDPECHTDGDATNAATYDPADNDESNGGPAAGCPPECLPPNCCCATIPPPECEGGLVPCGRTCDDPTTDICECCPCTLCHLFVLFKRIVDEIVMLYAFLLAVLMIVVGGIILQTAGGDPGRIGGGKKILKSAIIGIAIILLSWLIVDTVITFLTPASSPFQAWHTIDCPVP